MRPPREDGLATRSVHREQVRRTKGVSTWRPVTNRNDGKKTLDNCLLNSWTWLYRFGKSYLYATRTDEAKDHSDSEDADRRYDDITVDTTQF